MAIRNERHTIFSIIATILFCLFVMVAYSSIGLERDRLDPGLQGVSDAVEKSIAATPSCGHGTEIVALQNELADCRRLLAGRDARVGELERQIANMGDELAVTRGKIIEALKGAPSESTSDTCPRTRISRFEQEQATAVFEELRKNVLPELDDVHNFYQRAAKAYEALTAVWGKERIDCAIVDAKRAVVTDLGNAPYTTDVYEKWRAKPENRFAVKIYDWFGHL